MVNNQQTILKDMLFITSSLFFSKIQIIILLKQFLVLQEEHASNVEEVLVYQVMELNVKNVQLPVQINTVIMLRMTLVTNLQYDAHSKIKMETVWKVAQKEDILNYLKIQRIKLSYDAFHKP
jgi:hypothetical protein